MTGAGYEFGRFAPEKLWRNHIRYRLARRLIHTALFIMPEGRYKDGLLESLWALYDRVSVEVAANRATGPG